MPTKEAAEIKAPDTYFDVARKEFEDAHAHFDQIDNKATILLAFAAALPSLLLSFVGTGTGKAGGISLGAYGVGFIFLLLSLWNILGAVKVRSAPFGVDFAKFKEDSRQFDEQTMRWAMAEIWLKAAEMNSKSASKKAASLKRAFPSIVLESLFFLAGAFIALTAKV